MPGTTILGRTTSRKYTNFMIHGNIAVTELPSDLTDASIDAFKNQFYNKPGEVSVKEIDLSGSVSGYNDNKILFFWYNPDEQLDHAVSADVSASAVEYVDSSSTVDAVLYMCTPVEIEYNEYDAESKQQVRTVAKINKWIKVGDPITINENTLHVWENLYAGVYKIVLGKYSKGTTATSANMIQSQVAVFNEVVPTTGSTPSYTDPSLYFLKPSPTSDGSIPAIPVTKSEDGAVVPWEVKDEVYFESGTSD